MRRYYLWGACWYPASTCRRSTARLPGLPAPSGGGAGRLGSGARTGPHRPRLAAVSEAAEPEYPEARRSTAKPGRIEAWVLQVVGKLRKQRLVLLDDKVVEWIRPHLGDQRERGVAMPPCPHAQHCSALPCPCRQPGVSAAALDGCLG